MISLITNQLRYTGGVHYAAFVAPVIIAAGCFPFLGAPNRSLFAEAVDKTPELSGFEGTMQALLSMSASFGGFTAPWLITHFCLRTPDEVDLSNDAKEFTSLALMSPLMSLAGLLATYLAGDPQKIKDEIVQEIDETTPLHANASAHKRLSLQQEGRRASVRGSILCSMPLVPQTCEIFDEDECELSYHKNIV
jgi:hypothetical protein